MGADTPTPTTERPVLRRVSTANAGCLHRISNEPAVRRYLWGDEPVSEAAIRDLIRQSLRGFLDENVGLFGIRFRSDEALLGFCGFVPLEGMDEPELGYGLTLKAWGAGIAAEASRACLRYAFEELGFGRVIAGAEPLNRVSLRVLEKPGTGPVGYPNPRFPDEPYYAINREDLASRQR